MICEHSWREDKSFSQFAHRVRCTKCLITKFAKPKIYIDPQEVPFAANEYIAFKLIRLLISKGLKIVFPNMELYLPKYRYFNKQNPWWHGVVLIDDLGEHSRVTKNNINNLYNLLNNKLITHECHNIYNNKYKDGYHDENFKKKCHEYESSIIANPPLEPAYPDWLYYFDRWIGRLDGDNDSNLILISNQIIPIDFNLSFSWNNPIYLTKINNLDMPCHDIIKDKRNVKVLEVIKSLTDSEILSALMDIDKEFISTQGLISYYSGLCLRRDLLS